MLTVLINVLHFSEHSRYQKIDKLLSTFRNVYLVKLLNHLFNADVSILGDFALHVGEPLTELFVFVVKNSPLI